jgi:hypothetical protein
VIPVSAFEVTDCATYPYDLIGIPASDTVDFAPIVIYHNFFVLCIPYIHKQEKKNEQV